MAGRRLPDDPPEEWLAIYGHLKAARDHLRSADYLIGLRGRRAARIQETWRWLDGLVRRLRELP